MRTRQSPRNRYLASLSASKKIDWTRTPGARRQVFVESWAAEMTRQGVRA